MSQQYKNQKGEKVIVSTRTIATPGGEGAIFDVLKSQNNADTGFVAKIYHTSQIAKARQTKIEFMVANNPTAINNGTDNNVEKAIKKAIVWPIETLYNEKGDFVGFTMPKIADAITLKSLTLPNNPSQKHGNEWRKFDHNQKSSHQKRLVVAYNIAQAIHTIHKKGNYVLVDLKPENIFLKPNGSIAIIDLDSIQIDNPGVDEDFPAKVFTEEFAPPELHKGLVNHKSGTIDKAWDYFSLAVILYELFFGIHPFQASHTTFTTRPELIKNNLFVHGKNANKLHVIPNVHNNFAHIHSSLQNLFLRTFEDGQNHPDRRSNAEDWAEALLPILKLESTRDTILNFSDKLLISNTSKSTFKSTVKATQKNKKPNSKTNPFQSKNYPKKKKSARKKTSRKNKKRHSKKQIHKANTTTKRVVKTVPAKYKKTTSPKPRVVNFLPTKQQRQQKIENEFWSDGAIYLFASIAVIMLGMMFLRFEPKTILNALLLTLVGMNIFLFIKARKMGVSQSKQFIFPLITLFFAIVAIMIFAFFNSDALHADEYKEPVKYGTYSKGNGVINNTNNQESSKKLLEDLIDETKKSEGQKRSAKKYVNTPKKPQNEKKQDHNHQPNHQPVSQAKQSSNKGVITQANASKSPKMHPKYPNIPYTTTFEGNVYPEGWSDNTKKRFEGDCREWISPYTHDRSIFCDCFLDKIQYYYEPIYMDEAFTEQGRWYKECLDLAKIR